MATRKHYATSWLYDDKHLIDGMPLGHCPGELLPRYIPALLILAGVLLSINGLSGEASNPEIAAALHSETDDLPVNRLELKGVILFSQEWQFSVHNSVSNAGRWLKIGDHIQDWRLAKYDSDEEQLELTRGGDVAIIKMSQSSEQAFPLFEVEQRPEKQRDLRTQARSIRRVAAQRARAHTGVVSLQHSGVGAVAGLEAASVSVSADSGELAPEEPALPDQLIAGPGQILPQAPTVNHDPRFVEILEVDTGSL